MIIADPLLAPFFIRKETGFEIIETKTRPKQEYKHLKPIDIPKDGLETYESSLAFCSTLESAIKRIAREKESRKEISVIAFAYAKQLKEQKRELLKIFDL